VDLKKKIDLRDLWDYNKRSLFSSEYLWEEKEEGTENELKIYGWKFPNFTEDVYTYRLKILSKLQTGET